MNWIRTEIRSWIKTEIRSPSWTRTGMWSTHGIARSGRTSRLPNWESDTLLRMAWSREPDILSGRLSGFGAWNSKRPPKGNVISTAMSLRGNRMLPWTVSRPWELSSLLWPMTLRPDSCILPSRPTRERRMPGPARPSLPTRRNSKVPPADCSPALPIIIVPMSTITTDTTMVIRNV